MKELYEHTTFLFTNAAPLRCFALNYPEAARSAMDITFILALKQDLAGAQRLNSHFSSQFDPWYSQNHGRPFLMNNLFGIKNSSLFKNLKSIRIHVLNWEQSEERLAVSGGTPVYSGPPASLIPQHAFAVQTGVLLPAYKPGVQSTYNPAGNGRFHNSMQAGMSNTHTPTANGQFSSFMQAAGGPRPLPSFYTPTRSPFSCKTTLTKPVQVVRGADIRGWIELLAISGWKGKKARVTGMESLEEQGFIDGLEELLTK